MSYSKNSVTSVYPEVERVLRMPPYLDALFPSSPAENENRDEDVDVDVDTAAADGGEAASGKPYE